MQAISRFFVGSGKLIPWYGLVYLAHAAVYFFGSWDILLWGTPINLALCLSPWSPRTIKDDLIYFFSKAVLMIGALLFMVILSAFLYARMGITTAFCNTSFDPDRPPLMILAICVNLPLNLLGLWWVQRRFLSSFSWREFLIGGVGWVLLICLGIRMFLPYCPELKRRAPQTEAKIGLGILYTAEKAFFNEHGRYATPEELLADRSLGESLVIGEVSKKRYVFGIPEKCRRVVSPGASGQVDPLVREDSWVRSNVLAPMREDIQKYFKEGFTRGCPDFKTGFVFLAVGKRERGSSLDVWAIDQDRRLENIQVGN